MCSSWNLRATPSRRDAAVVILKSYDVVFAECSVCDFDDNPAFLGRQPMDLPPPHAKYFPLTERYREYLFAFVHRRGRVSLDEQPPFFAMMMVLQAQSLIWLYINSLEIPFTPLIPSVIFSPWTHRF